ncbi:MAG: FCSD flavin-binding domain-containing protein [Sulfuritalea sp.]|nr:FCSD flavin-binding domain-containing protein [Sulfuritalea sp.]
MTSNRREFLKLSAAGATLSALGAIAGCAGSVRPPGHVVVVGGGYGGATAAKYIRLWSQGSVHVTLVERNPNFVSCPVSNLVLGGTRSIADITHGYEGLRKHGVRLIQGEVSGIDSDKRSVKLANGDSLSYDRLLLAPGIDFLYDAVPGLTREIVETQIFHSWKAGPQTVALRKQLEDLKDGGLVAIAIPKAPYRCPPGPYERASVIAHYLKTHKPRAKLLILDANPDIVSKKGLFTKAWDDQYKGILEYRKEHNITALDAVTRTLRFEFGDPVKADVLNLIPPQIAGAIAGPFINKNKLWVGVDWLTLESDVAKNVHVIGDATFSAPGMPKSGHMANSQAKVAAAAIINLLAGQPVNPEPVVNNTCYSYVDDRNVVHVASVHTYDARDKTFKAVAGAGGLSSAPTDIEGKFAEAWAKNIWADTLG